MSAAPDAIAAATVAAQAASDKLATDIVVLDVTGHLPLADAFVVCTANNDRQLKAIVDEVQRRLSSLGPRPLHRESSDDWVLLDYPEIVVHVQLADAREFYRLEKLWSDCPTIPVPLAVGESS